MARQQADSEDMLKRQARRRLIGAVALVTAVVIILPMILEREPKPTGQNIDLRIPDKNKAGGFTSQMVLPEENAPASAAAATTTPSPPAVAKPAPPKPPAAKPAEARPVHKPKPATAKPVHKAAPVAAPAKAAPSKAASTKAGFAVQVGAFANADSARELQDKLLKLGLHAYTEKAGDNVRVRVGNYPTREDAEKVLHQLEAQGMQPAVVSVP